MFILDVPEIPVITFPKISYHKVFRVVHGAATVAEIFKNELMSLLDFKLV